MSYEPRNLATLNQGSPAFDAFGRLRMGEPHTLFDSKLLYDKHPLLWDEATVSGSGFTSNHLINEASVQIATDGTTGKFVRQTFQRFNYQPGKSQAIMMTGVLDVNGNGTFAVVNRTKTSGSVVDNVVNQADFNGDQRPNSYGIDASEVDFDISKAQIYTISFEWLGTGQARMGCVRDGQEYFLHFFLNDNVNTKVYMTTPNLPVRYEVEVTSTATITRLGYFDDNNGLFFQSTSPKGANSIKCNCSTVISEGGLDEIGILRYYSTDGTHVDANATDTMYAIIGIRLKSTHLDCTVHIINQTLLALSNDDFEWMIMLNPTVGGSFTYTNMTNSAVQVAVGATANTVTGGTALIGGFGSKGEPISSSIVNSIRLGSKIDGTPDTIVMCVRPLSINLDIHGSLTWRELL